MTGKTTRTVDETGKIVIPMAILKCLGIQKGDELEIFEDIDKIILQKYSPPKTNSNLKPNPPQTQNPHKPKTHEAD